MFKVFKLRPIITFLLIACLSFGMSFCLYKVVTVKSESRFNYTIVLDAGHGGRDNGCSGTNTGVAESELNLAVTKKLEKYLTDFGFNVVLTRKNNDGLYSNNVSNYKKDDMEKRAKIINDAKADMVISIHMNSFPSASEKGAQVFFDATNEESVNLANCIQKQFVSDLENARKEAQKGNYYILNCVDNIPTVIAECGFLTNPEEEQLLTSSEYQSKLAYSIMCGVIRYISQQTVLE